MAKPKAIFLYDFTGLMAKPWLDAGYDCWCFDGQHESGINREGNLVKVGMWFKADQKIAQSKQIAELVGDGVVMVFGFPECTDLTNAGTAWHKKKRAENPMFQKEATELALLVELVANESGMIPWAMENPVGALSRLYRKPDFIFNPCNYAGYLPKDDEHPLYPEVYPGRDRYNKKTCIWMGNGFKKPEFKHIEAEFKENPGWKRCGGKSTRTKNIRSATPRGFAQAVFEANSKEAQHG